MSKVHGVTARRRQAFGARAVAGLAGLALSSVAFGAESAPAANQDDPANTAETQNVGGETVYVTGQTRPQSPKATAPLLNTPQAVTVVPKELFTEQGARNLTDILRSTPGITFNAGENGFSTGLANFSLRGFDTSGSVFVDGARDSGAYNRDSFNIEQVEIVKGPAGDNGRGTAGGFVNIVTKTPFAGALISGSAGIGFDDYDSETRYRATLDVNQSLGDGVAGRINLLLETGGLPGRAVAERRTFGIAPSIAFGLGTPTRFVLSVQYVEQQDIPDYGVPAAIIDGMRNFNPALDADRVRDRFYGLSSDYDDATSFSALARVDHTFASGWNLTGQLRWADTERDARFTVPTGYAPATNLVTTQRQGHYRENQSVSLLANLSGEFATGTVQHRLAVGVEASWDSASAASFPTANNPGGSTIPVLNPNPDRAGAWTQLPTQFSEVDIQTVAAYIFDTIEISPEWQITGGLRVEHYSVSIDNTTAAGAPLGPDGYDASRTTVSGRLGLVYKPVENASFYAAVGVAAQPPGSFLSTPDISREGDNAFPGYSAGLNSEDARVQRSLNYELGVKWETLDKRLNAAVSLFRTERHNVAITGRNPLVLPTPPVALLGYGKQIVQGVEFSVAGQVTEEWSVFGGLLLMDSERKHSAFLDEGRRLANPADYGAVLRTSGDELAFTPNVSATLWTSYTFPIGLTIGGGVQYVGESWVGRPDDAERIIPNGNAGVLPSHWLLNAMVEYDITPDVNVRLNIENITDELYAVSSNWPATRVQLGAPRSFLLSVNFKL